MSASRCDIWVGHLGGTFYLWTLIHCQRPQVGNLRRFSHREGGRSEVRENRKCPWHIDYEYTCSTTIRANIPSSRETSDTPARKASKIRLKKKQMCVVKEEEALNLTDYRNHSMVDM